MNIKDVARPLAFLPLMMTNVRSAAMVIGWQSDWIEAANVSGIDVTVYNVERFVDKKEFH